MRHRSQGAARRAEPVHRGRESRANGPHAGGLSEGISGIQRLKLTTDGIAASGLAGPVQDERDWRLVRLRNTAQSDPARTIQPAEFYLRWPSIPIRLPVVSNGMARLDLPVSLDPDPVIEAYKRDVDMTQVRERLKLTPAERVLLLEQFIEDLDAIRGAARPPA